MRNALARKWIRLTHWEYWPMHWVYAPIYFYWFWLCLKSRSFFFFNTANPGIRNGGFLIESKKEIYDLMPAVSYPATVCCRMGETFATVIERMHQHELSFPLIAKPDIGLRGMSVSLIYSIVELEQYHLKSKVDYLLQAYINFPEEAGIFYYRIPGQKKGHISGIVGKEFLKIKGDGFSTMQQLLQAEDRYTLQLPQLQLMYGKELLQVLPLNEEKLLVPFGNHCRGAKFIDITHRCNEKLLQTIDHLAQQVPGFYFGRMDIKYLNWNDLCDGKNFSVIELNGAGSEPAHIYDPRHSLLFGWKEIIRHLNLLYTISKMSKQQNNLAYMTMREGLQMFRDNNKHLKLIG